MKEFCTKYVAPKCYRVDREKNPQISAQLYFIISTGKRPLILLLEKWSVQNSFVNITIHDCNCFLSLILWKKIANLDTEKKNRLPEK